MKARTGLGLSAAALAWLCLSPGAFAAGQPQPNTSTTFSAETVALPPGNSVTFQGGNLNYSTLGAGIPAASGVSVSFVAPAGNTFTVANLVNACLWFPGAVATNASLTGTGNNIINCPVPPAGGPFTFVQLVNGATVGNVTLSGPDVAKLGANIYPGLTPLSTTAPSALVQITETATSGGAFTGDATPIPALALLSRNSFTLTLGGAALGIDLTGNGLGATPPIPPGGGFAVNQANGTRTVSTAGFLGTVWPNINQFDLDARTGLNCINGPSLSGNPNCAAALSGNTAVTLTGDFATITTAYLLPNQAAANNPVANQSACTPGTPPANQVAGTIDIAKRTITFANIPTPNTNTGSNPTPVFSVCLVTNGTQVIQTTDPANVQIMVVVTLTSPSPLTISLTNAPSQFFATIAYQGSAFFAQNVFGINNGSPTFFRMVNPSNTAAQVWAVLTKDVPNSSPETGAGSCNFTAPATGSATLAPQPVPPNAANPPTTCNISFVANLASQPGLPDTVSTNLASGGSAGKVQANNATYVTGDDIAILSGTSLNPVAGQGALHATVWLLSPNPAMRFSALTQSAAFGVLVQSP
jgi:hypothetical protein